MVYYRIEVNDPNGVILDETIDLSRDQVSAYATIGTAIFEDYRDTIMRISAPDGRILDLDETIRNTQSVAADGESAFELGPEAGRNWLDLVEDSIHYYGLDVNSIAVGKVTKPHTVKAAGEDGSYLIQFEGDEFFDAMVEFMEMLGYNPKHELAFLHYYNEPLEL